MTGGTGFLGAYIIKELIAKGYAVRAIRRSNKLPFFISPGILEKVEWVEGDVLDVISLEEAMEGVDAVIHCAAIISFLKSERKQMYKTNIEGTANAVNMALENNIKRFVFISSVAALGRTVKGDHVNEEKKWEESKINTHYAITKHHAEMEVWRSIGEGLNAVIINPSTILGYGDWNHTSTTLFKNIYDKFSWYTTGINGFVDVEDVAKATVSLMESPVSEERFIISGENWTFQQLFNTIADGFTRKHPSKRATPLLGEVAWRVEKLKSLFTGKHPILSKESARVAHSKTFFDNTKLQNTLPGFSFTPLKQSIALACKKYLDAINGMQP